MVPLFKPRATGIAILIDEVAIRSPCFEELGEGQDIYGAPDEVAAAVSCSIFSLASASRARCALQAATPSGRCLRSSDLGGKQWRDSRDPGRRAGAEDAERLEV